MHCYELFVVLFVVSSLPCGPRVVAVYADLSNFSRLVGAVCVKFSISRELRPELKGEEGEEEKTNS